MEQPSTPPTTSDPAAGSEIAEALVDVMQDQAHRAKARAEVSGPRAKRAGPVLGVLLVLLSLFSAYLWFGSPAVLQPEPLDPITPELEAAGLRMEVFLQASAVEEFQAREGRLPTTLAEAGDPYTEVVFEAVGANRYRLRLSSPSTTVEYDSVDPLEGFLGNAVEVVIWGGK